MEAFDHAPEQISFLFVNDGSTDGTLELLEASRKEGRYILDLDRNRGKAEAVRCGMLHIRNLPLPETVEWVGFIDADLATPVAEIINFTRYDDVFGFQADAIWGCRVKRMGSTIRRSPWRHLFGRAFATIVGLYLKTEFYDSQCGAKLFKKALIGDLFQRPFISRWIFDVEIYMRMKEHTIVEYPLQIWQDVGGSKINIPKMLPRILYDIWRIKRTYASRQETVDT